MESGTQRGWVLHVLHHDDPLLLSFKTRLDFWLHRSDGRDKVREVGRWSRKGVGYSCSLVRVVVHKGKHDGGL